MTQAFAATAPNPRGSTDITVDQSLISRRGTNSGVNQSTGFERRNSSPRVVSKSVSGTRPVGAITQSSRAAVARKSAMTISARSASQQPQIARVATNDSRLPVNISRAGVSRATAVFSDISKLGGGYATCRETYNTCMDQFCASASDTYRRCICSERFRSFKDSMDAITQAKVLLQQFSDNNLNAIDKTASEVDAMYSASIGEAAIKKDTSASAAVLSEIADLLSGNKKASNTTTKLDLSASLDFSTNFDDIWGNNGSSSFGSGGKDLSTMDGIALYNEVNKQCTDLSRSSCEADTTMSMVRSAYSILIGQDCNLYEKNIDAQKEAVANTVREANKVLRNARLEEYRSHNSQDVNDCIAKVKTAILGDNVCGANYKRCMDTSGLYIDVNTGEPIYSPHLFKLTSEIKLESGGDILSQNMNFSKFLDSKKMFASGALDSCRDISDAVWSEFKRSAVIEIAQAQDAKIEEVKMSCVSTMKDCYDTQGAALKSFDDTTAQISGALSARASKAMCQEKVAACAALYTPSGGVQCAFDKDGKITNGDKCGLAALRAFVDTVDNTRIAEGCKIAIDSYVKDLCAPLSSDTEHQYPYGCRLMAPDELRASLVKNAWTNCMGQEGTTETGLDQPTVKTINEVFDSIAEEMDYQLMDACQALDGYWQDANQTTGTLLTAFYSSIYAGKQNASWGRCVQNDTMVRCLAYNSDSKSVATYDKTKDECTFTEEWFTSQCGKLGNGYFENNICYVTPN